MGATHYLCIDKCPSHGYMAVSIENEFGGTRLTSSKCCGQWQTLHRWPIDALMVENICSELGLVVGAAPARARKEKGK